MKGKASEDGLVERSAIALSEGSGCEGKQASKSRRSCARPGRWFDVQSNIP